MLEKNICVVTGTRAEYGALKLVIKKIMGSKKLNLSLLVTGMHLLENYGYTIEEVKKDGIPITKIIPMYKEDYLEDLNLGIAVGEGIINFTKALKEIKPDLLIVAGDRFESLAAVIAASTLSIPIAHIQGGDNIHNGQIDDQIRHGITKFAHIHFPATPKSYERIKLMGEEEWRINMVGAIALDMIYEEKLLNNEELCKSLGLNSMEKIILCIQHPYVYEADKSGDQMYLTLKVLKDLNLQTVIIYPNNDPGSKLIIKEIEKLRNHSNFKIYRNLERLVYLSLLKNANLLIGNSSSGFIESSTFKLPVVNIGNRNKGREHAENVIDVNHDYAEIRIAVLKGLSEEFKALCQNIKNPYGEGKSSDKIVKIIEDLQINKEFLIKKLTYEV